MHILKIVNKGLLCKSADKYGMQKMGLEHRSSLNNRHCILCDLTTICSGMRRPGLTQFSCDCDYQNSSHTPRLPITPTLQHCDRCVTCNYSSADAYNLTAADEGLVMDGDTVSPLYQRHPAHSTRNY